MIRYWSMSQEAVIDHLASDSKEGLSSQEAAARLERNGRNTLQISKGTSKMKILLSQITSPLILILIVAAAVTIAIGHYNDAAFIFIAVVVNSALGFWQENKAESALAELKSYLRQRSRVIRDGREREIDAEEIVTGDVVHLSQGDRVPADARVLFENDFQVDESVLTGESLPVGKFPDPVSESAGVADQTSMVFAGTLVTQGVCTVVACRTDSDTEIGKIASLLSSTESERTPLQKAIARFSIRLSAVLCALTVLVFVVGVVSGKPFLDMFLTSVAIAISAIPEGLPISMTVILAIGVERMAKRQGVVRKLIAAEALGSTTLILTDKTGTLTRAEMTLSGIIPVASDEGMILSRALKNTSVLVENPEDAPQEWRMTGKIMETALVRSAALRGVSFSEISETSSVLQTIPFNAVRKFSLSFVKEGDRHFVIVYGASDVLINRSSLSEEKRSELLATVDSMALSGERVLGLATYEVHTPTDFSLKNFEPANLTFEGFISFRDPVRPGIAEVIRRIAQAGIRTVIVTGDHRGTATAVAEEVGIYTDQNSVLDASELGTLSDQDLASRLPHVAVISRVTPSDKLRIAQIFQKNGEVVAMTGDGVNDAPSIKQADVGIAMGSGTEVARSVADLVLLDDNFETIVAAIEEGRQILGNIRKVLVYLLSNVTDGLILIGGSILLGLPLPLNALQILWVNFFSDSFPAIAFAFEKDGEKLGERPAGKQLELFTPMMKFLVLVIGLSTSVFLFVLYFILLRMGFDTQLVHTFIFSAFGTYTLFLTFSVRSFDKSIVRYPLFSNSYLNGGVAIGLILMAAAVYVPFFQNLFDTVPLPPVWLLGVLLVGVLNIVLIEIAKFFFSRRTKI